MSDPVLSISRRTRVTPFHRFNREQGVKAFTVYNHMLLPTVFRSVEEDYWHLKRHAQIWDVSVERQVEIKGPDAARLAQSMTPRDLRKAEVGQCLYAPLVDENGGLVNDPIIIKTEEDCYWLSLADSDALLWAKGLAYGARLDVSVREPEIWPLAVQGPKSEDLMAAVFGEDVRAIRFFRSAMLPFRGHPLRVARSGWSKQGGFEIYVDDADCGRELAAALWDAGQPFDVRAGCPNLIERIEGGLLSYGSDMALEHNPLEVGLGKYCQIEGGFDFIGRAALAAIEAQGIRRKTMGLKIVAASLPPCIEAWTVVHNGKRIGEVSSAAISPQLGCGVAFAMLDKGHWAPGHPVHVESPAGALRAEVAELPFIKPGP